MPHLSPGSDGTAIQLWKADAPLTSEVARALTRQQHPVIVSSVKATYFDYPLSAVDLKGAYDFDPEVRIMGGKGVFN